MSRLESIIGPIILIGLFLFGVIVGAQIMRERAVMQLETALSYVETIKNYQLLNEPAFSNQQTEELKRYLENRLREDRDTPIVTLRIRKEE